MDRTAVFEIVRAQAVRLLDLAPEQLTEEVSFVDDLGVDSLAFIEFAMAVEDALGITLSEEDLSSITHLGAFVDLATQKVTSG